MSCPLHLAGSSFPSFAVLGYRKKLCPIADNLPACEAQLISSSWCALVISLVLTTFCLSKRVFPFAFDIGDKVCIVIVRYSTSPDWDCIYTSITEQVGESDATEAGGERTTDRVSQGLSNFKPLSLSFEKLKNKTKTF